MKFEKRSVKYCHLKVIGTQFYPNSIGIAIITVNSVKPINPTHIEPFENTVDPDQLASGSTMFSALYRLITEIL